MCRFLGCVLFTVSVGDLPPGASVLIKITDVAELLVEGENIVFSLPGSVAPGRKILHWIIPHKLVCVCVCVSCSRSYISTAYLHIYSDHVVPKSLSSQVCIALWFGHLSGVSKVLRACQMPVWLPWLQRL